MPQPAYRIQTPRLVLRCWEPRDTPLLQEAIAASLEHLRPWMEWARAEPRTLEEQIARLRVCRARFDTDQDYVYGILNRDETQALGSSGLHTRLGDDALEIGYWIHADYIGQGLATETAAALTRIAFEINKVQRVEIHCAADNTRSAAVPRKLGYVHEATLREREFSPDGRPRDMLVWTLLATEYPASPAAGNPIEAFDVVGRRLL